LSFSSPFFQGDEARAFPVEVGDSACADGDVLSIRCVSELHNLQIVGVVAFLEIAELIAQASFVFDQLDEVLRGKLLFDGPLALLEFGKPLARRFELLRVFSRTLNAAEVGFEIFRQDAFFLDEIDFLELAIGRFFLH
jgi:hypothetical protein